MESFLQDPALLQEFLVESEELLQRVDQDLVKLEAQPTDEELLNRVFRALHTIKGTAGFLGFEPIVRVGHRAEDVLTNLRRGQLRLNRRIMDALLRARDQLGKMLGDLRGGGLKQYSLEALLSELESVQVAENAAAAAEIDSATPAAPEPEKEQKTHGPSEVPATIPPTKEPAHESSKTTNAESARSASGQTMRVDVRKLDELVNLIGELVLERNRLLQVSREISAGRDNGRGADSPLGIPRHASASSPKNCRQRVCARAWCRLAPCFPSFRGWFATSRTA